MRDPWFPIHVVVFFAIMLAIVLQWIGVNITDEQISYVVIGWCMFMIVEGLYRSFFNTWDNT